MVRPRSTRTWRAGWTLRGTRDMRQRLPGQCPLRHGPRGSWAVTPPSRLPLTVMTARAATLSYIRVTRGRGERQPCRGARRVAVGTTGWPDGFLLPGEGGLQGVRPALRVDLRFERAVQAQRWLLGSAAPPHRGRGGLLPLSAPLPVWGNAGLHRRHALAEA